MKLLELCAVFIIYISHFLRNKVFAQEKVKPSFKVICPPFDIEEEKLNLSAASASASEIYESFTDYCSCRLYARGSGRTAIIKCDFQFKENIILTSDLFNFTKWNSTSAYVRMINSLGVKVTSEFLSSWMDSPSSAMDLWHCGKVTLESTPEPHFLQLFAHLRTFVGVGFVECNISSLPQYFLRDRSRAALRMKDCHVDNMKEEIFHNVEEVRYLVIENCHINQVEGPASSSGKIQLSRKSMHSWDGFKLLNSTVERIATEAFVFAHKSDTEDFIVRQNTIGKVEYGGISANGDIKIDITQNTFNSFGPEAIKIDVTAPVVFSRNVIKKISDKSLWGIDCQSGNITLENNTFYLSSDNSVSAVASLFRQECGLGQVSNLVYPSNSPNSSHLKGNVTVASATSISLILIVLISFIGVWLWRKGLIRTYKYRRQDTPLCREETQENL